MQILSDVVVAVSVVVVVFCTRPSVLLCCCANVHSTCRCQQQKVSSSSSASSTAAIVVVVSVAVVACSSRQCHQCGADMPRVAVFLQTGVLSPYPVALLAADAPSLPVTLPPLQYEEKKHLSLLPPPPFRANPHCTLRADEEPLPPCRC